MQQGRLVIKGTILTQREKFIVGEDLFSSVLFSLLNSWLDSNYTSSGLLKTLNLSELKSKEFGRIKSAIYGFTEDLHNLSINYSLFNEIKNNQSINRYKNDLYFTLIIENLFINIRSIYDFFYHFIKICLTETQLKQYPATDSLNKLISFTKNIRNKDKLPKSIINYLNDIEKDFETIKEIRDKIVHKGKNLVLTRMASKIFMRIPIKEMFSEDNLLPNILNVEDVNFDVEEYFSKMIKTTFKNMETLGFILLSEIYQNDGFSFGYYSITNYCIDEFNNFLLNNKI